MGSIICRVLLQEYVYVYLHVYIYVYIWLIHMCRGSDLWARSSVGFYCKNLYIYLRLYVYVHIYVFTCTRICICMFTSVCIYIYMYVCKHVYDIWMYKCISIVCRVLRLISRERVMSHIRMSHVTHMNESCHTPHFYTYGRVMSCFLPLTIWMSHITHMNESWHTHEWVVSHI